MTTSEIHTDPTGEDDLDPDRPSSNGFLDPESLRISTPRSAPPADEWIVPPSRSVHSETPTFEDDIERDEPSAEPPQTVNHGPVALVDAPASKKPRLNTRMVLFASIGIGAAVILLFGATDKSSTRSQAGQAALASRQLDDGAPRQFTADGDQTLGSPEGRYTQTAPPPDATPLPSPSPAMTPAAIQPAPTPEVSDPDDFDITLVAGERLAKEDAQRDKESDLVSDPAVRATKDGQSGSKEKPLPVPKGTKVQMSLVDPLRSGVATTVTARVLSDVVDSAGRIVIPKDATAGIPFMAYEVNRRVLSDPQRDVTFILPSGESVVMRGSVRGQDGYPGLSGKLLSVGGPSKAGRILSTAGNTAARVGGREIGNVSPDAEDAVYNNTSSYDPYFERESKVVQVAANTNFYFVAGW